jgi:hypothetical protein
MDEPLLDAFRALFTELCPDTVMPLASVYAPGVTLVDPFRRVEGLEALSAYFTRQNARLKVARFEWHDCRSAEGEAFLTWTSRVEPARGPRGPLVIEGATHLRSADGRITFQRDYFDGTVLFEQVPLLGRVLRVLKRLV